MCNEHFKILINELENKLEFLQMQQVQAKDKLRNLYETLFDQAIPYPAGILKDISQSYPSFFPEALELYQKHYVFDAIDTLCVVISLLKEIEREQKYE